MISLWVVGDIAAGRIVEDRAGVRWVATGGIPVGLGPTDDGPHISAPVMRATPLKFRPERGGAAFEITTTISRGAIQRAGHMTMLLRLSSGVSAC